MKKLICVLLFIYASMSIKAQYNTTGTEFWIGFFENFEIFSTELKLYITSDVNNSGTISIPSFGWTQNFTILANGSVSISLPASDELAFYDSNVVLNKGIKVVSVYPIAVYAANESPATSDASLILPTSALGDFYMITSYDAFYSPEATYSLPSDFVVVGVKDNTVIEITPISDVIGGVDANTPFTVTLDEGQVYLVKSNFDLTGSIVKAIDIGNCNNFAVFAGNKCANVPFLECCCDHLYEQMIPVKAWGLNYITSPLNTRIGGDIFRILASENETVVNIDGGSDINLDSREFYEVLLQEASHIVSNKPISVAQYSRGTTCDSVTSDPFMIMLSPMEQVLNYVVFQAFDTQNIEEFYVNIVSETAYTGQVLLDGSNIYGWQPVAANLRYSYVQKTILSGTHIINAPKGVLATVYGFGRADSYGYLAGANIRPLDVSFNFIVNEDTISYNVFDGFNGCSTNLIEVQTSLDGISDVRWNFGDGSPVVGGINKVHEYQDVGSYIITMSFLRNGSCVRDSIFKEFTINRFTMPFSDTVLCSGSFLSYIGSAEYTYIWQDGSTNPNYTFTTSGNYSVTVTDSNNCIYTEDFSVTNAPDIKYVSNINLINCNYEVLVSTIIVNDGTPPYSILWQDGSTSFTNTNIPANTDFGFIITDASGCNAIGSINSNSPSKLEIISTINNVKCKGLNDGFISVSVTGGLPPYSILWDNNSVATSLVNLSSGSYGLTVTDSNNCNISKVFIVTGPINDISLTINKKDISCNGLKNGSVFLQANNGTPPYYYKLYNDYLTYNIQNIDNLIAGTYTAYVKDKKGCEVDTTITINEPLKLTGVHNCLNPSCLGKSDGAIEIMTSGGTKPYMYYINDKLESDSSYISNLFEGNYTISIIDRNLCKLILGKVSLSDSFVDCIKAPNAFTPNNDGTNDNWIIEGIEEFPEAKIEVYNQWGQEVFNSEDANKMSWNGKYNNNFVPTGSYIYIINLYEDMREHSQYTGIVTVIY